MYLSHFLSLPHTHTLSLSLSLSLSISRTLSLSLALSQCTPLHMPSSKTHVDVVKQHLQEVMCVHLFHFPSLSHTHTLSLSFFLFLSLSCSLSLNFFLSLFLSPSLSFSLSLSISLSSPPSRSFPLSLSFYLCRRSWEVDGGRCVRSVSVHSRAPVQWLPRCLVLLVSSSSSLSYTQRDPISLSLPRTPFLSVIHPSILGCASPFLFLSLSFSHTPSFPVSPSFSTVPPLIFDSAGLSFPPSPPSFFLARVRSL